MTHKAADDVRGELRFPAEVRTQFRFLEALGFKECESSPTYVRYARSEFVIEIYHGRQSYELGLNLLRDGLSYSLQTLLAGTTIPPSIRDVIYGAVILCAVVTLRERSSH